MHMGKRKGAGFGTSRCPLGLGLNGRRRRKRGWCALLSLVPRWRGAHHHSTCKKGEEGVGRSITMNRERPCSKKKKARVAMPEILLPRTHKKLNFFSRGEGKHAPPRSGSGMGREKRAVSKKGRTKLSE